MKFRHKWLWICLILPVVGAIIVIQYYSVFYTRVYPVFRSLENQRLTEAIKNYESFDYNNFRIRCLKENGQALDQIQHTIRLYGDEVSKYFDYYPRQPIEVVIYPNLDELCSKIGISPVPPTMGAYSGGKLHMVLPASAAGDPEHPEMLSNVFIHELTHLMVDYLAKGNFPMWFTEGSALFMEYTFLGYEWGQDVKEFKHFTLEDLTHRFSELDEYLAYKQSFLMVRSIIETFGRDKYLTLLKSLGRGKNFSSAMEQIFDIKDSKDFYDLLGYAAQQEAVKSN